MIIGSVSVKELKGMIKSWRVPAIISSLFVPTMSKGRVTMGKIRLLALILVLAALLACLAGCGAQRALAADELLFLGERYFLDLEYEQALVQLLKVIEIEPMNPRGYIGAAVVLMRSGQSEKAIEILQQGLDAVDPDDVRPIRDLFDRYSGLSFAERQVFAPTLPQTLIPTTVPSVTTSPETPAETTSPPETTPPETTSPPETTVPPTPETPPTTPSTMTPPPTMTPTTTPPATTNPPTTVPPVIAVAAHNYSFEMTEGDSGFSVQLTASSSTPLSWSLWSAGGSSTYSYIGIDSSKGILSVSSEIPEGTYSFIVTAENEAGSATQVCYLTVKAKRTAPLFAAQPHNYEFTIAEGSGGYETSIVVTGAPVTFTLERTNVGGRPYPLPDKVYLDMDSGRLVFGADIEAGVYYFTIRATNDVGSATQACVLEVTRRAVFTHVT